jgi:hypothetical protein
LNERAFRENKEVNELDFDEKDRRDQPKEEIKKYVAEKEQKNSLQKPKK